MVLPLSEAAQIAQRWMAECLDGHDRCREDTHPRSYPTRLLELGESTARIIFPAEANPTGPYAALSCCWGPRPNFLRLTASNARELHAGILYSDLPTAFQEAIRFIKGLGNHYLWIDSLCIIQAGPASTKDWQSESAQMHEVYSNSLLSLALSRAKHPGQSCLGGWTPDTTPPFEVETTGIFGTDKSVNTTGTVVYLCYYHEALYGQPLRFRAWTLQERLLAPRLVSFGHGELFWECVQVPNASKSLPRLASLSHAAFRIDIPCRVSLICLTSPTNPSPIHQTARFLNLHGAASSQTRKD